MKQKGQVATEYMIITGFFLVIIAIIFTYAFVVYNESINSQRMNSSLEAIVSASEQVYGFGQENILYVDIELPDGVQGYSIRYVCRNVKNEGICSGNEGVSSTITDCCDVDGDAVNGNGADIKYSEITATYSLLSGAVTVSRDTRAPIFSTDSLPTVSGKHTIKVSLDDFDRVVFVEE